MLKFQTLAQNQQLEVHAMLVQSLVTKKAIVTVADGDAIDLFKE